MKTLKVVALGLLFSFVGSGAYLLIGILISIIRGPIETNHATGLSAVLAALMEATVFNPIYWLGIALAFVAAFWLITKAPSSSTPKVSARDMR